MISNLFSSLKYIKISNRINNLPKNKFFFNSKLSKFKFCELSKAKENENIEKPKINDNTNNKDNKNNTRSLDMDKFSNMINSLDKDSLKVSKEKLEK